MDEEAVCSICLDLLQEPLLSYVAASGPLCYISNLQQSHLKCLEHEEKLKLFCEEDGEAICVICRDSKAHRHHTVLPIQEAANDYQNKVKRQREGIKSECEKLRRFVSEEEQRLLQRLEEEERETLRSLEANVAQLSRQSSSLRTLISEIEEKSRQTPAELLKDVKRTLDRSKDVKLQETKAVSTELKTPCSIPGMVEMLRKFTVDVTLDPGTAHPKLVLSEDRKCVRLGDTRQLLPNTPKRFDTFPCVLGSEGITGGRRYWEGEVGDKTQWALGVCRESVRRKGVVVRSPGDGFWVVCLRDGDYKALTSPWTPLPVHVWPRRVGVFLDYEGGEVSFYNVTDRSHLFTFTDTFSGTLRPFFSPGVTCWVTNAAPLTLCPVPAQP
ncbi:E3 ubiquitin-protein ligase TRIM39-like [Alligator sinensis]|uniref:E3 ubiquitin-protein ligase TRIM39-like n=1 Tax=Alligator sinensis TaxID=38654 RepID=A0A3Q0FYN0_ALLSI|nr:E3 ubiquitin-protein ligase TRIM39-like [Alligator sinensis]